MDTDEFRSTITALGLSQGAVARILKHLGDDASPITIRRRVERWAQGRHAIPGEAGALMVVFKRYPFVLAEVLAEMGEQRADPNLEAALAMADFPSRYPLRDLDRAAHVLVAAGHPAAATAIDDYLVDQSDEAMSDAGLSPANE